MSSLGIRGCRILQPALCVGTSCPNMEAYPGDRHFAAVRSAAAVMSQLPGPSENAGREEEKENRRKHAQYGQASES